MTTLIIETRINAPPELCFDLARDIGFHCQSAARTQEKAIAPGRTEGLIEKGETVIFEAVHFGIRQKLSAVVDEFDRPHRFADTMTSGAFSALRHVHEFLPVSGGDGAMPQTLMRDTLIWTAPWGVLGQIADGFVLRRHMRRFLWARNASLKAEAERRAAQIPIR